MLPEGTLDTLFLLTKHITRYIIFIYTLSITPFVQSHSLSLHHFMHNLITDVYSVLFSTSSPLHMVGQNNEQTDKLTGRQWQL